MENLSKMTRDFLQVINQAKTNGLFQDGADASFLLQPLRGVKVAPTYQLLLKKEGDVFGSYYDLVWRHKLKTGEVQDSNSLNVNYRKALEFTQTPKAYWSALLLDISTSLMPLTWHAYFLRKKLVLSDSDLVDIGGIKPFDLSELKGKYDWEPKVELKRFGATITYYSWFDGTGLTRHVIEAAWDCKRIYFFREHSQKEVVYEYDCGMVL